MPENTCLNADQLKSFALGRLDDLQTELVSQHLKDCPSCEETLSGFDDTNDSLLLQIRTAQPPAEDSPAQLEAALAGIAALHSDGSGTATQPSETLNKGTQPQAADDWVRDYRLVGKLGQGGMGTVYKAVHERLQRTVAIKLLPARRLRNREAIGRFEREMQAIGRLDHPAIVRATDAGEVEGTHFLAMDYVNGIDLSKVVRLTGPLSVPNACEVIRVVATGLSYAHEQGLIHRDVKPSNIMLALPDGGGQASVKLLDLGLALFGAASEAVDDFTTVGQLMGTLDYMAPEQADHSHVNATADVYSMGATLFKLLTGKAPFETRENQSPLQKMKALATMSVPSLQDRRPETPPSLVAIADQLLQRDPSDRMSSAAEVSEAMQPFCEGHNLKQLAEQAIQEQALEDAKIETEILPSAQPSLPSALLKSPQLENGVQPAVASGAGTNNNNNRWKRWLAGFAAVPLFAFLGAIIWIQTDRGTLKIESVAADVPIEVRQGKQLVESFTLKSGPNEISLRSGRHEVKIAADYDQLQMSNSKVEIQRGGEAIVRVEHVAEGVGSLFRSSGPLQGKSAPPKKTPDPLGLDPEEWLADYDRATYRVGSGDLLAVYVKQMTAGEWAPASRDKRLPPTKGQPSLILDDGQLHMPCVNVSAALLTVDEIERKLYDAYRKSDVIREGTQVVVNVLERRTTDSEKFVTGYRSEVGDTLAILIEEPHNPSGPKPDWRLYTKAAGLPACILGDLYTIESSGNIGLPYIKPLPLTGLSLSQIRSAVSKALVDQEIFRKGSFSVSVGVVSSQSSEKFTQVESNEGGAGRGPIFEGRTYSEWKTILNRERSPEELTKAIDALAALSDDSKAAETCEAILKIMDRFSADLNQESIESQLLNTGIRRLREMNPKRIESVLQAAFQSHSPNTCTIIIGELCAMQYEHVATENGSLDSLPLDSPFRKTLFGSDKFVAAAFRSFERWGAGSARTPVSYNSENVLLGLISERMEAQKPLTPAMSDFCRQIVDQGMDPENSIPSYTWQAAVFVLLETTDQEDLLDLLWKRMTSQDDENRWNAWRMLAESPIAIRKMLPLLKAKIGRSSKSMLVALIYQRPGDGPYRGYLDLSQQPHFYRSTLIVELMGLAGKDAISCRQLLSDQFMLHTGAIPKSDGVHTYQAAEDQICTRLNNLEPAKGDTENAEAKATLRHVQALLWAWEQITGEPAKFAEPPFPEPQFPKLAEFPKEMQPKIAKYNGKTIAEWAEYDGTDFESWEAEKQRSFDLYHLNVIDADKGLLGEAKERLTEFCLADYRDDEHWFELVASIASDSVNAVGLTQLLQKVSPEERAKIFCRSLALSYPFKAKQVEDESPASSLIVFLTVPMDPSSEPSFSPVLNEIVRSVPELSVALQIDVLKRLVAYRGQLSSEALKTVQQLSTEDAEIGFLANLVATRQWSGNDPTRDVFIDRLLQQLEQPGKDDARWVNAALSLGVAVRKGATLDQLQRLVKIVEDTTASKSVDVLWRYTDGPPKAIAVSRRVLALQILSELAKTESGVRAPSTDPARANMSMVTPLVQFDWESVRKLAGPAGAPQQVVSLMPDADDANQVYYVQSVRPSSSTDELVASEWAARVLEGVGMLTR